MRYPSRHSSAGKHEGKLLCYLFFYLMGRQGSGFYVVKLGISQAVIASLLNTSLSTVQKWETGEKHPGGPSQQLLNILDRKGIEAMV